MSAECRQRASVVALLALCLALGGCHSGTPGADIIAPVIAQSATPGTVTVTWSAPTAYTNGQPITGALSYVVYEMQPCGSDATCAVDTQQLGAVATGVTGLSVQVNNVPDGLHCYSAQTVDAEPSGATEASALTAVSYEHTCVNMTGSTAPQPTPNSPSNVQVKAGS